MPIISNNETTLTVLTAPPAAVSADYSLRVAAPPAHDFSIRKGRYLRFCSRCGDEDGWAVGDCPSQPLPAGKLAERIEMIICARMQSYDWRHRIVFVEDPAGRRNGYYGNVSAALTVIGGWNRRDP